MGEVGGGAVGWGVTHACLLFAVCPQLRGPLPKHACWLAMGHARGHVKARARLRARREVHNTQVRIEEA